MAEPGQWRMLYEGTGCGSSSSRSSSSSSKKAVHLCQHPELAASHTLSMPHL